MIFAWLSSAIAALCSAGLFLAIGLGSLGTIALTYLAPMPLFLVGLSYGGSTAGVVGTLGAFLIWAINGSASAILYFLSCALPVALICDKAGLSHPGSASGTVHWYPSGLLCLWLIALPVSILVVSFLYLTATGSGLEAVIAPKIKAIMEVYRSGIGANFPETAALPPNQIALIEKLLVNVAPAMVAVIWMTVMLLNAVVAQAIVTRFGWNMRPAPRLADIELPRWIIVAFAATFLIGITIGGSPGFLASNLSAILAFPVFLSGLGVVHAAAARTRLRYGILSVLYVVLIVSRWASMALVIVGLVDHFTGLKSRLRRGSPSV